MSDWSCPICGAKECEYVAGESSYDRYYCKVFDFKYFLAYDITHTCSPEKKELIMNLVTEHMLHANNCIVDGKTRHWHFYDSASETESPGPEYVNVGDLLNNYPDQVIDKAHRSLVNLSLLYPRYGDIVYLNWYKRRVLFEHETNNSASYGMFNILTDLGYLKDPEGKEYYMITVTGWQKIEELRKNEQILQQAFIAMAFCKETEKIREAFRTAISESGYSVRIIDEKEHNNQIVPEIFFEIERSKFLVVDITYPNYGAYYEAGYAQALGKQVIVCCQATAFGSKDKKKRPHFDISQKSMIVWTDETDLIVRLKRRIEATVK